LSFYILTKKYNTYLDILQFDFEKTSNYFEKILKFLDKVVISGYIFRDLNLFRIGFEYDGDNTNFIFKIIKYTNNTLVSLNGAFFSSFSLVKCFGKSCIGSIIPFYVIDDYYNLKEDWIKRLNKSYCLGLCEIILILFYNSDENLYNLYKFIIGPSYLESKLQFFHVYNRFGILNNYQYIHHN
jgi:hypothetical protein